MRPGPSVGITPRPVNQGASLVGAWGGRPSLARSRLFPYQPSPPANVEKGRPASWIIPARFLMALERKTGTAQPVGEINALTIFYSTLGLVAEQFSVEAEGGGPHHRLGRQPPRGCQGSIEMPETPPPRRRQTSNRPTRPAMLGSSLRAHVRFIIACCGCGHRTEPDIAELAERYGVDTPVPD
jgi:hypothetical protein